MVRENGGRQLCGPLPTGRRFFQELLRHRLCPRQVWNEAFPQGKYAQQRGLELGLASDKFTAAYKYHGKR